LKRADVPTDYGASWSTLFLSPVLGALTGWFGVLLIHFASEPQFGLLGGPLRQIRWEDPGAPGSLFGAFLLGFSERMFDSIMQKLETQIDKKEEAAKKPSETEPLPMTKTAPASTALKPAAPGDTSTVSIANLDSFKATKVVMVAADGKETNAAITAKPNSTSVSFTVPDVAKGSYSIKIFAPDPVAGGSLDVLDRAPLSIATGSLPPIQHAARYTQTLKAAGGAAPYKWSAQGLPAWLALTPDTGVLDGPAPDAPGPAALRVTVTDSANHSASKDLPLTVA
jgi:hypothetical protein